MDIVIPLGSGSSWSDNELRYSLRSIQKYCFDAGDVYIVGRRPNWLRNIIHIPFEDKSRKEVNIWKKVFAACNDHSISENFFFCNDDFFFLKPFFCSHYPNYHKGDIASKSCLNGRIISSYFQIVKATLQLLQKHDFPTLHFDIHRPMVMNKQRFKEVFDFFSPELNDNRELIMKSCYGNYHFLQGPEVPDVKIGKKDELVLEDKLADLDMFSIHNSLIGKKFATYMASRFPEKSRFEE